MLRRIALIALLPLALSATTFAAPAAKAKRAPEKWATGQVERYDASTKTLVLKQGTHEMTFLLASQAKVTEGKKTLASADLGGLAGHEAKVRYTSQGDSRQANHVQVIEKHAMTKAKPGK